KDRPTPRPSLPRLHGRLPIADGVCIRGVAFDPNVISVSATSTTSEARVVVPATTARLPRRIHQYLMPRRDPADKRVGSRRRHAARHLPRPAAVLIDVRALPLRAPSTTS
ncbi:hypothetical protein FB107DRAFT_252881, partial [Schizophyllum commune]